MYVLYNIFPAVLLKRTDNLCLLSFGGGIVGLSWSGTKIVRGLMPDLKTRMLFISHAWQYEQAYLTLESWFDAAPNFSWKNCSVPSTHALPDKTTVGLAAGITRQMNPAQGVLIIAGMYAAHSGWIDYEISEARRMNKTIIGIRPWGQERLPVKVQEAARVMVNWNSQSVIDAVRLYI